MTTRMSQLSRHCHFIELFGISEQQKRDFYTTFAARERWSVRTLRSKLEQGSPAQPRSAAPLPQLGEQVGALTSQNRSIVRVDYAA